MPPEADVLSESPKGNLTRSRQTPVVPYRQSSPIEVDGVFLGMIVKHHLGVQFTAVDRRVADMDRSIWPTPEFARTSACQLFRSNRLG